MSSLPPNVSYHYMAGGMYTDDTVGEDADGDTVVQSEKQMKLLSICQLTTSACALLGLPVWCACTANYYLRRFFSQFSMDKYDPVMMAQACILQSGKVHEYLTRIRDVVTVVYHLLKSPDGVQQSVPSNAEYWVFKPKLVEMEHCLLRALNFHTEVDLPHNYVLQYARALELDVHITNSAFYVCNDMFYTDVILYFDAPSLATAAIVFACHLYHGVALPDVPFDAPKQTGNRYTNQNSTLPTNNTPRKNAFDVSRSSNSSQAPTALHDLLMGDTGDSSMQPSTSMNTNTPNYMSLLPMIPSQAPAPHVETDDARVLHHISGHIANRKLDTSIQTLCNKCDIPRETIDSILDQFVYVYDVQPVSMQGRCAENVNR